MDITKKLLSIVGVLALTMSMSAGIAAAQTVGADVTITVVCASTNAGTTTYSLGQSPAATNTSFSDFDPAGEGTTSSTEQKALRLTMDIAPCEVGGWSFSASITDFSHESSDTSIIPGSSFSLPAGEPDASVNASSSDGELPSVVGPNATVTFTPSGVTDVEGRMINNGSEAIATHDGTTNVAGEMSMDFTGVLSGLGDTLEAGTYSAEITVTFTPGGQP